MNSKKAFGFKIYLPVLLLIAFSFIIAITRWIPHPPNFSPIIAIIIWASSLKLKPKTLMQIVFGALVISDAALGFYSFMWVIYPIYLILAIISYWHRKKYKTSIKSTALLGLGASSSFFVLSNLGVFLTTNYYPPNLGGLLQCYAMAVPFFQNTLASTFVFLSSFYALEFFLAKKVWNLRLSVKNQ